MAKPNKNNGDPKKEKRIFKALSGFRKQYDKDRRSFAEEKFPIERSTAEGRKKAGGQVKKRVNFVRNEGKIPGGLEYKVTNPKKQTANQKIVFDKLNNLNNEDLGKLKSFANNVAKQFIGKNVPESINTLRKVDLTPVTEIRKKVGLTKDEILNLIETNEKSSIFDKATAKAVKTAVSLKKFKKGGSVKPIKRKK